MTYLACTVVTENYQCLTFKTEVASRLCSLLLFYHLHVHTVIIMLFMSSFGNHYDHILPQTTESHKNRYDVCLNWHCHVWAGRIQGAKMLPLLGKNQYLQIAAFFGWFQKPTFGWCQLLLTVNLKFHEVITTNNNFMVHSFALPLYFFLHCRLLSVKQCRYNIA